MFTQYITEEYDRIFDAMLSVMRLIYIAGCVGCLALFYQKIMGFSLKKRQYKFIVGIVYGSVLILGYYIPVEIPAIAVYGTAAAVAFAISYIVYESQWTIRLYVAVTILAIQYMIFAISVNMVYLLLDLRMQLPAYSNAELISYILIESVDRAGVILLTYLSVRIISKQFKNVITNLTVIEAASLILPSAALLLNLWLLANAEENPPNITISSGTAIAGAVSLICVICIAMLFKKLNSAKNIEKSNLLLEQQAKELEKRYIDQKEIQKEKTALLHDYRNQLQTIKTLAKNGEISGIVSYINQISDNISSSSKEIRKITGNPVVDSILAIKTEAAKNSGKEIQIIIERIPDQIKTYDISLILSNALDNAIEADCDDKDNVITVRGSKRGGIYVLVVENEFIGTVKHDGSLIESTKGKGRGFGIANITTAAEKYNGIVEIVAKDGKFSLSVMLKY